MIDLGTLIHDALERNASDIHLTVGEPPVFRLDGELTNFGEVPLTEADTTAYVQELITPGLLKEFHEMGEADFAVTYHDLVRMRCNVFRQRGMTSLALRLLPLRIATAEELGLPPWWWRRRINPADWCSSPAPPARAKAPLWRRCSTTSTTPSAATSSRWRNPSNTCTRAINVSSTSARWALIPAALPRDFALRCVRTPT